MTIEQLREIVPIAPDLTTMIEALEQAEPDERGAIGMTAELRDCMVARLSEIRAGVTGETGPPRTPPPPHLRGGT